ncbi:cytochrome P450 [Microdochium bolleyi]|uniref:Cytochrome P450 n=1 Tax=Microdochium bolleyi TaxID=196109 RepID=A0A136IIZ8_9PEZI|nr:cytochrome P450 [Microdochium bolleyi]
MTPRRSALILSLILRPFSIPLLAALHAKYGDVARLGPNSLSLANPEALKTIYGLNKGMIKSDFYVVQQALMNGHSLASLFSTTDEAFHARFRRCVNAAFSMSALVQYEPFVDNTTRLFLSQTERLFADNSQGCDFPRWLQFYAFDVIGEITYGKRHGFIKKNEDIDGIVAYLSKLFCYVAPVSILHFPGVLPSSPPIVQIPWLDKLLLKNPVYLKLAQWGVIDATFHVARFARARMNLTMAGSMAFAGSETTAISPAAFARDGGFSDPRTGLATWPEAQKLPYLDACVKEAFRMHPAAGLPLERIVPVQGIEIDGVFVLGGTIVGTSAWVIHHRPEIFGADADVYRPERWLADETGARTRESEEKRIKEMNGLMFQFGMRSRTCIGKNISLLEIYKFVPSLLRRFEIEFKDPRVEWELINA